MRVLERETTEEPTKLALLRVDLKALAGALHLPEGYQIIAAGYNQQWRVVELAIASEALPAVEEGAPLPTVDLVARVEWPSPELREYRKITTEIKVED